MRLCVDLKVGPVGDVGRLPLLFVALKLPAVPNERRLGCQRKHFGFLAHPIVVHPLCVLGVTHQAGNHHLTVDFKLVADDADDRDPFARPVLLFQHLKTVGFDPLDLLAVYLTGADRLDAYHLCFRTVGKRRAAVRVKVQRGFLVLVVEVLRNPHGLFVDPLAQGLIPDRRGHDRRDGRSVGKLTLKILFQHVLRDEAPLSVGPARILNRGIHEYRERVADSAYLDVLIERIVVAILRQNTYIPLAVGHLAFARGVIRHVGIRDVLDMPNDAVEDFRDFRIRHVVSGDYLATGPVLPLVVGNLPDVLGQLVDRQARARVDRLPLHAAASRQNVCRPLELIVRRPCGKAQIVQFVLARTGIGVHRHLQTLTSNGEKVFHFFVLADCRKALAVGAPEAPGLRIFSPLPALMRSRLEWMFA